MGENIVVRCQSGRSVALTPSSTNVRSIKIVASKENRHPVIVSETPVEEKGGIELGPLDRLCFGGWSSKSGTHIDLSSLFIFGEDGDMVVVNHS